MKVAFLTKDLDAKAGWGSYSMQLINALKIEGVETVVLTGKVDFFEAKRLVRDCDIVHSLVEPLAFLGSLIKGNRPFFITAHGTYAVEPLDKLCSSGLKLRYAYKKADAVVCVSHFTESEIKKRATGINTVVINNGVDFDKFQKSDIARPAILGNRTPIIFSVGALKFRKGFHISISAVVKIKELFPNFLYIISGDQSDEQYYAELKNMVSRNHLENNVVFVEADDQKLVSIYKYADLFLLTPVNQGNHFEGFGLVYLEAGACGVPSVGSKGCGAEDAIKDGQTGFLVEQNNIEKVSESILKIVQDNHLRQKLGRCALEMSRSMSWEKTAQAVIRLYQKSLLE